MDRGARRANKKAEPEPLLANPNASRPKFMKVHRAPARERDAARKHFPGHGYDGTSQQPRDERRADPREGGNRAERMLIATPSAGELSAALERVNRCIGFSDEPRHVPKLDLNQAKKSRGLESLTDREHASPIARKVDSSSNVLPILTHRRVLASDSPDIIDLNAPNTGYTSNIPPPTGKASLYAGDMLNRHHSLHGGDGHRDAGPGGDVILNFQHYPSWSQSHSARGADQASADSKAVYMESKLLSHRELAERRRELSTRQLLTRMAVPLADNSGPSEDSGVDDAQGDCDDDTQGEHCIKPHMQAPGSRGIIKRGGEGSHIAKGVSFRDLTDAGVSEASRLPADHLLHDLQPHAQVHYHTRSIKVTGHRHPPPAAPAAHRPPAQAHTGQSLASQKDSYLWEKNRRRKQEKMLSRAMR
jgi:hypothetical protein